MGNVKKQISGRKLCHRAKDLGFLIILFVWTINPHKAKSLVNNMIPTGDEATITGTTLVTS